MKKRRKLQTPDEGGMSLSWGRPHAACNTLLDAAAADVAPKDDTSLQWSSQSVSHSVSQRKKERRSRLGTGANCVIDDLRAHFFRTFPPSFASLRLFVGMVGTRKGFTVKGHFSN
jgi:hypothetical protein